MPAGPYDPGGAFPDNPFELPGNLPAGVPIFLPLLAASESDFDYSQVIDVVQGETLRGLAFAPPEGLTITAALLVFSPRFGDSLPALPALYGDAFTNAGLLQFEFPASWGNTQLPTGDWLMYAQVTYSTGQTDLIAIGSILRVWPAPAVLVISALSGIGPFDPGGAFGDDPYRLPAGPSGGTVPATVATGGLFDPTGTP